MRALEASRITIVVALLGVVCPTVPAWAGAAHVPDVRQADLRVCPAGTGPCVATINTGSPTTFTCSDGSPCQQLNIVAQVVGNLVISVLDSPTCPDNARFTPCSETIPDCSTSTKVQFSARQVHGNSSKAHLKGGRPLFSIAPTINTCVSLEGFFAGDLVAGNPRLTEVLLLLLSEDDLLFQPMPPDVATPLLQGLGLSSGTVVVTRTGALTQSVHAGTDPLPSQISAPVEISVVQ